MSGQLFHTIKLLSRKTIAKDIVELRFEKPAGFSFVAGQFVQFRIPYAGEYVMRSYSISSAPVAPYLEFCIKILPDGKASQFFAQLSVGGEALLGPPRGFFVTVPASHHIFVATGTGLAPIMSMVESALGASTVRQLIFGVRSEEDLFWIDRLQAAAAKDSLFHFRATLSRPGTTWAGLVGRVTDHLLIDLSAEYYICGNVEMVKEVRAKLVAAGLSTKSIHLEIF